MACEPQSWAAGQDGRGCPLGWQFPEPGLSPWRQASVSPTEVGACAELLPSPCRANEGRKRGLGGTPPLRTSCPLSCFRQEPHAYPVGSACGSPVCKRLLHMEPGSLQGKAVCSALDRPWGLNEFCIFMVSHQGLCSAARPSAPARCWKWVHNKLKTQMGSERRRA